MSTSSSGASGKPPPAAAAPDIADRRQAIVAEIRHDLKNAHLAAAAALRQVGALARDGRLTAALAGLQAAVGEVQLHSERGLELLSLGVDDVEPALEPMALEPILREVELARRAAAELAGIALRSVPTGAVAAVDARLLARCVGNLVGNAIEHSGARRALIGVRRRGAGCVIEVRDDGRGIDVEALRGVDGRRWAEGSGRGLGLWIASRFARLLGGELDVRAQARALRRHARRPARGRPGAAAGDAAGVRAAGSDCHRCAQPGGVLERDRSVVAAAGSLLARLRSRAGRVGGS